MYLSLIHIWMPLKCQSECSILILHSLDDAVGGLCHYGPVSYTHLRARNHAFDVVSNDKSRPVGISEDDKPPFFRSPPKQGQLVRVLEDPEAAGLQNQGIHHLGKRILVIPALYHDGLSDTKHESLCPRFSGRIGQFQQKGSQQLSLIHI